jgi:phosphoglucomutase
MLVCELAASLKMEGKTILDALDELYAKFGYYLAYVQSVELTGADAMEKAANMMTELRVAVPESIGGARVTGVRDYRTGVDKDLVSGKEKEILLPRSNVLEFLLGESGSVIVRPSGTEPKVKFYYTAVAEDQVSAKKLLDEMVAQMSK